jgi:tungstate transport system ATP-binding protein
MAYVEVRDLRVQRNARTILEVDRLDVDRGEVLAVIGPNGAGKTTLFLALAHLIKTPRSAIRFDGQWINRMNDLAYRRRLALVLQEPLLLERSVEANVALGLKFRGIDSAEIDARVTEWLARLGIDHLRKRRGTELSGGEAQRVSLARAFVLQPDLLLLDEPFTALDAPTRARLVDELKSILHETRTTTIFITHDLGEARRLADRVAIILDGRLRQAGMVAEVFANPADESVARFVGA